MDSITEVRVPPKVDVIKGLVFWGCGNLKRIYFEGNLREFDNRALQGCLSLEEIKLSKKNKTFQMKNGCLVNKSEKSLVYALSSENSLDIPDGIKSIKTFAFNNCRTKMVFIPSSVNQIEEDAFGKYYLEGNKGVKNITVSKKNRVYAKDGQCIYNKKEKTLVAAIVDKNGELKVSEKIRNLTDIYSMVNYDPSNYKKVVFPKKLKCVTVPAFRRIGHAEKVYYTALKPPKIKNRMSGYASLPIFTKIYVPKKCLSIYQDWYKKYKCYSGNKWRVY